MIMYNPWFQLVASLISMIMIANLQYAWTLFVNPLQEATRWELPTIQLAFTIFINLQTFVQPLEGWIIDKMGRDCLSRLQAFFAGSGGAPWHTYKRLLSCISFMRWLESAPRSYTASQ